jgi:hypothetical protein
MVRSFTLDKGAEYVYGYKSVKGRKKQTDRRSVKGLWSLRGLRSKRGYPAGVCKSDRFEGLTIPASVLR